MDHARTLLETAYTELEAELAAPFRRALRGVRSPEMKWVRRAVGAAFIAGGCMAFLPVLGLELLPIGLLLVAEDVPVLRDPTARAVLWMLQVWRSFKARLWSWASGDKAAAAN
jgi:hypothetical protein